MNTRFAYLLIAILVGLSYGCSPKAQVTIQNEIRDLPWYMVRPQADTPEFLYATGSHVSQRRDMARSLAELNAQAAMAQKLGTKIEALQRLFIEEITETAASKYSSSFTQAIQSVTSQTLVGFVHEEVNYVPLPDGRFEVFILLKMPVATARQQLDRALSSDQELYRTFQNSEAFKQMTEGLERVGI